MNFCRSLQGRTKMSLHRRPEGGRKRRRTEEEEEEGTVIGYNREEAAKR